jgi:hypothetical protein
MSRTTKLTVKDAAVISKMYTAVRIKGAEYLAAKDDAALARIVRATAASLRKLTVAGVEPEVRLHAEALTQRCWVIFKAAKREQVARVAEPATEQRAFDAWVDEYNDRLHHGLFA